MGAVLVGVSNEPGAASRIDVALGAHKTLRQAAAGDALGTQEDALAWMPCDSVSVATPPSAASLKDSMSIHRVQCGTFGVRARWLRLRNADL